MNKGAEIEKPQTPPEVLEALQETPPMIPVLDEVATRALWAEQLAPNSSLGETIVSFEDVLYFG